MRKIDSGLSNSKEKSVFGQIDKVIHRVAATFNVLGTAIIPLVMIIMILDIFGRTFFNKPFPATPDIVANTLTLITFMQITYCLRVGRHIKSDMLPDRVSPRTRYLLDLLADILGLIVMAVIAWGIFPEAMRAIEIKTYDQGAIRVPTWPSISMILVGSTLMSLQFLVNVLNKCSKVVRKENLKG